MSDDLNKINRILVETLSQEKGYFGRVFAWGNGPTEYKYIGYELSEDFLSTLQKMSNDQKENLVRIINYFNIYAVPLKNLLTTSEKEQLYRFNYETAWSHFMTVIMFGMLEIAVKGKRGYFLNRKREKIKNFLEINLPKEIKESIAERYHVEEIFKYKKKIENFSDVVDHLWDQIRSGFIHDVGIEARGLEWGWLEGIGTKENPITLKSDVPMQELLQITWQAILNSYSYKGILELPKLKKIEKRNLPPSSA